MTIKQWLGSATKTLKSVGIASSGLDCLILLEDALGKDRAWLLAHPEYEITSAKLNKLNPQITQRAQHTPLAFVRGKTNFYGREFFVDSRVLEPRPESETMIELLLELPLSKYARIADIGTGSGALGITAKLERPGWNVALIDIDPGALDVAHKNCQKHAVNVPILQSDLLASTSKEYGVLLANLPYVPDNFTINHAAMHEPRHAIFGGSDGLDIYRRLFEQTLKHSPNAPEYILTEALPPQHETLTQIAKTFDYKIYTGQDFIQVFKAI